MLAAADLRLWSLGPARVGPFSNDFVTRYCYIPRNGCAVSARGLGCQAFDTVLGTTAVLQLCSHLPRPRCGNAAVLRIQRV